MALAMAAAVPTMPSSPIPFAPIGLTCGSSSSIQATSIVPTSALVAMWYSAKSWLKVGGARREQESMPMIIQTVKFKSALSEEEVRRVMEERAPQFHALPGLLQKYYVRE